MFPKLIFAITILIFIGCNSTADKFKEKELQLREREIALKEKELSLKIDTPKSLQVQKKDTPVNTTTKTTSVSQNSLPKAIIDDLNKSIPNWSFSKKASYCEYGGVGKSKSLIAYDFDNNGQMDYAVKIKNNAKGFIFIYLQDNNIFTPHIVYNATAEQVEDCKMELKKSNLQIRQCEVSSFYLVYSKGKFVPNYTSD